MNFFLRDSIEKKDFDWKVLIEDIQNTSTYNPYCHTRNHYEIFKHLVLSLVLDEEVILLDHDFTEDELLRLAGASDFSSSNQKIKDLFGIFSDHQDLLKQATSNKKNWRLTLFTSGTTGLPKKISHTFETITRSARVGKNYKENVWGYAYNPTHMAGVQVFFQAFLNGNPIIRLFGLSKENIYSEIERNQITNISATPTFYRLLLPHNKEYPSVNRITTGGEKFDKVTLAQVEVIFPNAKVNNVYASTEVGSLLASNGDVFKIDPNQEELIQIVDGELLIHKTLAGESKEISGDWYHTGDMVEIIDQNPQTFKFLSRKNEMINTGGSKVNPHEVEQEIRRIEGVMDVRVFAKKNSVLGSIVCCEVIRLTDSLSESTIRSQLQSSLQEFKIPRIVKFVDDISITRSGKIRR